MSSGASTTSASTADADAIKTNPVLECEYLAFSGGGTRGFAFPAAVQALEDYVDRHGGCGGGAHFLEQIRGFAGSSIGAVFAMLYAAGYTSRSLREEILTRNVNQVFANASPLSFLESWGLDDGQLLENWIEDLLERRFGRWARKITFAQFEKESRRRLVIGVVVMTDSDLGDYTEYVSAQTYPSKGVASVVRTSMPLPAIIAPRREYTLNNVRGGGGGGRLCPRSSMALWTDGALIDCLPYDVFGGKRTLGLMLMPDRTQPMRNVIDYLQRTMSLSALRATQYFLNSLSDADRQCIVHVTVPGTTLDLGTTTVDKQHMFDAAYASTNVYLQRWGGGTTTTTTASNDNVNDNVNDNDAVVDIAKLRDAIATIAKWAALQSVVAAAVTPMAQAVTPMGAVVTIATADYCENPLAPTTTLETDTTAAVVVPTPPTPGCETPAPEPRTSEPPALSQTPQ